MSAQPAYEPFRRSAPRVATRRSDRVLASQQRRRREQRFRQRRRDLLVDTAVAFVLAITALIETAGLGVIALASFPLGLMLAASVILERRARKRRQRAGSRASR